MGGGKILWIGSKAELPELPAALRATAETLDLEGARLIPGLIDAHVHVTAAVVRPGFTPACRRAADTLHLSGVTTAAVGGTCSHR